MNTIFRPVWIYIIIALLLGALGCSDGNKNSSDEDDDENNNDNAGISEDIITYCQKLISCWEGNEADENACIQELNGNRNAAEAYGCRDEWDATVTCYLEESTCEEINYDEFDDFNPGGPTNSEFQNEYKTLRAEACRYYTVDYNECEHKNSDLGFQDDH